MSKVVSIIEEGQGHLPTWLGVLKNERGDQYKKIMSMISIGEELKTKLGKLRTPYAMNELHEIHKRYVDILDTKSADLKTSSSSIPLLDHSTSSNDPVEKVLNFLSNIEETKGGTI